MADEIQAKKRVKQSAEDAPQEPEAERMSLDSFIAVKGYNISILHRMEIFIGSERRVDDLTVEQWEQIFNAAMNRVTA